MKRAKYLDRFSMPPGPRPLAKASAKPNLIIRSPQPAARILYQARRPKPESVEPTP